MRTLWYAGRPSRRQASGAQHRSSAAAACHQQPEDLGIPDRPPDDPQDKASGKWQASSIPDGNAYARRGLSPHSHPRPDQDRLAPDCHQQPLSTAAVADGIPAHQPLQQHSEQAVAHLMHEAGADVELVAEADSRAMQEAAADNEVDRRAQEALREANQQAGELLLACCMRSARTALPEAGGAARTFV